MLTVQLDHPLTDTLPLYRIACRPQGSEKRFEALDGLQALLSMWKTESMTKSVFWATGVIAVDPDMGRILTDQQGEIARGVLNFQNARNEFNQSNNKRLQTAEEIGAKAWCSIREGTNRGVFSRTGIIEDTSHCHRKLNIRGGRDTDTLRRNWKEYKGVVHLGVALHISRKEGFES